MNYNLMYNHHISMIERFNANKFFTKKISLAESPIMALSDAENILERFLNQPVEIPNENSFIGDKGYCFLYDRTSTGGIRFEPRVATINKLSCDTFEIVKTNKNTIIVKSGSGEKEIESNEIIYFKVKVKPLPDGTVEQTILHEAALCFSNVLSVMCESQPDGMHYDQASAHSGIDINDSIEHLQKIMKFDEVEIFRDCADFIQYINSPKHYLVKQSPNLTKHQKATTSPKAYEAQSQYIVMDPEEIKTRYVGSVHQGGTHASPVPHMRSGHIRTMTADRYKNAKNTQIYIRPMFIGEKTWVDASQVKYEVICRPGSGAGQA